MSRYSHNIRFLYWHILKEYDGKWSIGFNRAHFPIPSPRWWIIFACYSWNGIEKDYGLS